MKMFELEKLIFENISKINLLKGKEILEQGQLKKICVKKIDDNYNIYGKFNVNAKTKLCSSHLVINVKDKIITMGKCDCEVFLESQSLSEVYLCENLAALALSFANQVKKKVNNINKNKVNCSKDKNFLIDLYKIHKFKLYIDTDFQELELNFERTKLNLNISIAEYRENNKFFDVYIYVEHKGAYKINNIKEFMFCLINSQSYQIARGLIYNPEKFYFSKEDIKIVDYIYEYLLISNDNIDSFFRINKEILRRFLKRCISKKIRFIYNYQTYVTEIKNEDLPISFTLKEIGNEYILTTKKNMPIPLNKKMDIFFYDRKIYIPSQIQVKLYKPFYDILKRDKKIIIQKDMNINYILYLIRNINLISNNLQLDESILNNLANCIKIKFNFQKREESYYCNINLVYNGREIQLKEALKLKDTVIKNSKKIGLIESELNKNRFYYKDGEFIYYGTDEEFYNFLKRNFEGIKELGEINVEDSSEKYFKLYGGNYKANIFQYEENSLKFIFELEEYNGKQLYDIINAYKNKKSFIKLKDETFVDLKDEELKKFIGALEDLNINIYDIGNENKLELGKIYYINNKFDIDKINIVNGNKKISEVLQRLDELEEHYFEIPKNFYGKLREYQVNGFNWLKNLSYLGFGGILADEMGLGKTIQTIAFLLSEKNKNTLIVTPTALIHNWKEELYKFAPKFKVGIVHGNRSIRLKVLDEYEEYDILLTTFGTLKNDIKEFEGNKFDYLIIDEGQNINNSESQNAKAVRRIKSNNRFVLTGTPIENNLMELWALFDFIMPGYLYTKEKFIAQFIDRSESLKDLKILIKPYILRRTKKEVLMELPEKIEKKYYVEMTKQQKQIYNNYIMEIKNNIKTNSIKKSNITVFSYLTRLRQICLDPSTVIEDYLGGSGKIDIAKEILTQRIKLHKILLFSQFTSVLMKLANELQNEKIEYLYMDGNTSSLKRVELVDKFNKSNNIRVFLISLKAWGTGLNLTSADTVIHFDPWWNIAAEDQATDRAHRIGQKNAVEVIKLIAKDTIEENILQLQDDKKELIEDVITSELGSEKIISKLKNSELVKLLFS